MKRAIIGLMALLIAITAIAATQYGRVQLTATATLSHQFKDVQFVSHDFAPEDPVAPCGATADRVLCSDGDGTFVLGLGTWTRFDVKVFSGAFGIANAELGVVTIDRITCLDTVGLDICDYMNITAHSNANMYCYGPAVGDWQASGAETGSCVSFWEFGVETAAGTWDLAAADGVTTGYPGGTLTYGATGACGCYAAAYDAATGDETWESAGGDQTATSGTDTHVWIEVALDFSTLAAADANAGAQSALIYVVFSVPGP
jgi:hypothetical protein